MTCEPWDSGCHGGNAINAYKWIHENYITDETCAIYVALDRDDGLVCDDMAMCKDCQPGKGCFAANRAKIYQIEAYGII